MAALTYLIILTGLFNPIYTANIYKANLKNLQHIDIEGIPVPGKEPDKRSQQTRSEHIPVPPKEDDLEQSERSANQMEIDIDESRLLKQLESYLLEEELEEKKRGLENSNPEKQTDSIDDLDERGVDGDVHLEERQEAYNVRSWGNDCKELFNDARVSQLYGTERGSKPRDGTATDTDTCDFVRGVPEELRSAENMFDPIDPFYTKYTEAFGIPILGSNDVTDEGLMRACYVVKYMFGPRYDIKNCYYLLYGRFVVIGDNEQQTYLPEYMNLDPDINNRVRGLGPSLVIPVTSAGGDNMRCKKGDRYWDQDIGMHEIAHAVHQMGAVYTIPGFDIELKTIFKEAMDVPRYEDTYAAENYNEFWAAFTQIYFGVITAHQYYDDNNALIDTRDKLRAQEPKLVALMDKVYPCNNHLVRRCDWKKCNGSDFTLKYMAAYKGKSYCRVLDKSYTADSIDKCSKYTCHLEGNVFNYKPSQCQALFCEDEEMETVGFKQGLKSGFDVYKANHKVELTLANERLEVLDKNCANNKEKVKTSASRSRLKRCTEVTANSPCGPDNGQDTLEACEHRGCCFNDGKCVFPIQDCADKSIFCPLESAEKDVDSLLPACKENPVLMMKKCPNSCDSCDYSYRVNYKYKAVSDIMCQDEFCTRNPKSSCGDSYMNYYCKKKCGLCTLPDTWYNDLGLDEWPDNN